MISGRLRRSVFLIAALLLAVGLCLGQAKEPENKYKSQEINDSGTPVLLTHLPEYDNVASQAVFAKDLPTLKAALGDRPVLDLIEFEPGTEAVTAPYPAGKLLIVEFASPQASVDLDEKLRQAVAGNSSIVYRRIGNYNAMVFDVTDTPAANALLDQVHYEKDIQWLGDAPAKPTRGVSVPQMANVLLSSILWLVGCGVVALAGGGLAGWLYWRRMKQRRAALTTFSDAGGMTRLNLDGFTPEILPERLLGK